jgi:hypothetical protein
MCTLINAMIVNFEEKKFACKIKAVNELEARNNM